MNEVKATMVVATLRMLWDQARGLQGNTAIQELIDHGALARAAQAAEHERHARRIITMMASNLAGAVLSLDDFGPWYQSLDELVLRSSRLVLWTQVSRLQALIDDMQRHARANPMSAQAQHRRERWLARAHVLSFVQHELARIDTMWTSYRPGSTPASPVTMSAVCYRAGVAMAQFAIRELGRNQVIAQFFRDGTSLDPGAARAPCELVLGVLELEISTIPDELWRAPPRATVPGVAS